MQVRSDRCSSQIAQFAIRNVDPAGGGVDRNGASKAKVFSRRNQEHIVEFQRNTCRPAPCSIKKWLMCSPLVVMYTLRGHAHCIQYGSYSSEMRSRATRSLPRLDTAKQHAGCNWTRIDGTCFVQSFLQPFTVALR